MRSTVTDNFIIPPLLQETDYRRYQCITFGEYIKRGWCAKHEKPITLGCTKCYSTFCCSCLNDTQPQGNTLAKLANLFRSYTTVKDDGCCTHCIESIQETVKSLLQKNKNDQLALEGARDKVSLMESDISSIEAASKIHEVELMEHIDEITEQQVCYRLYISF